MSEWRRGSRGGLSSRDSRCRPDPDTGRSLPFQVSDSFPREGLRSWRIPLRGPRDEYPPRDFLVATRGNQNALSLVVCNMYAFYGRSINVRLLGRSVALRLILILPLPNVGSYVPYLDPAPNEKMLHAAAINPVSSDHISSARSPRYARPKALAPSVGS